MIEVKDSLRSARNHRRVNTIMMSVILVMLAIGLWIGTLNRRAIGVVSSLATSNTLAIAEVKANQDVNRQQYLDYIKDMIDAMNKLQEDNPKLKVPRAPVPRALQGQVTASDLRRTPQDAPAPTPIIQKVPVYIHPKKKPSPTPNPYDVRNWFKRTR